MGNIAISVENLGKCYRIGHAEKRPENFRAAARSFVLSPFEYLRSRLREPSEDELFWALKDVSFEVKHGEVLGIIGRNGAGKSTLLKILSRITEPTTGRAKVYGRVGSLLEVGTGFHPELTGRENIYLNGTILGMKRAEIDKKFDEIVDFSGVEKFLDTPVKRYSSGMYVRLAFAVAAHLEPNILLVDEVLAVGDIAFQKKCLGKIKEVSAEGRTVLLVSHNMDSLTRLCDRAILFEAGQLKSDGAIIDIVQAYLTAGIGVTNYQEWTVLSQAPGNEIARMKSIKACTSDEKSQPAFDIRFPIMIEFEYWVCQEGACVNPAFFLYNEVDTLVFISAGAFHDREWGKRPHSVGLYKSCCWIPGNLLSEGTFTITAILNTMREAHPPIVHVDEKRAIAFQVYDKLEGGSARGSHIGAYYGVVRPILKWQTHQICSGLS